MVGAASRIRQFFSEKTAQKHQISLLHITGKMIACFSEFVVRNREEI